MNSKYILLTLISFIVLVACNENKRTPTSEVNKTKVEEEKRVHDEEQKAFYDSLVYATKNMVVSDQEYLLFCPYCMAEISEIDSICGACKSDLNNDAPFEMTQLRYDDMSMIECGQCSNEIPALASKCMHCFIDVE